MRIEWSRRARKDARKLPEHERVRIIEGLGRFAEIGHGDIKRLADVEPPEYRLRVGDYRAFLSLGDGALLVLRVLHRRDAY